MITKSNSPLIDPDFLHRFFLDSRSIYVLLSTIFILSFGPFNSIFSSYHHQWNLLVLLLCVLFLILELFFSYRHKHTPYDTVILCFLLTYLAIIVVITLMHWLALTLACCDKPVNVTGQSAVIWIDNNLQFSLRYLYFPIIYYLQFKMIKRLNPLFVIRVIIALTILSSLVLLVQKYFAFDTLTASFFINIGRIGGLATDPNAYALTAFLVLPLMFSALFLEKMKAAIFFYWPAIFLLITGIIFSGSRTGLAGCILILFLMMIFTIIIKGLLTKRNIVIVIILVSVVAVLATFESDVFHLDHKKMEGAASRLLTTWEAFEQGGVHGVFFNRELRGEYFLAGYALGLEAPFAGWGPGGFYREIANYQYLQQGIISHAKDSVLNHYLMILVDFGVIALLLNMIALFSPLVVGFIAYKTSLESDEKILIIFLLMSLSIFLLMINVVPPSYFPGVLWVWISQMVLLHKLFMKNAVHTFAWLNKHRWFYFAFTAAVLFLVIAASYNTTFGQKGYLARQDYEWWPYKDEYGCYQVEKNPGGDFRWCNKDARVKIPLVKNNRIFFEVVAFNPDIENNPVVLTYRIKDAENKQIVLSDHRWKKVELINVDNKEVKYIVLEIKVSRSWIPKEWDLNNDMRELGVALRW